MSYNVNSCFQTLSDGRIMLLMCNIGETENWKNVPDTFTPHFLLVAHYFTSWKQGRIVKNYDRHFFFEKKDNSLNRTIFEHNFQIISPSLFDEIWKLII